VQSNGTPSLQASGTVTGLLENGAKFVTVLVIVCYAIGYLIVVLNESQNGFLETSLFKPRAIAAGAVFVFYVAFPISIMQTFFGKNVETESLSEMLSRCLLGLTDYVASGTLAAFSMIVLLADWSKGESISPLGLVASFAAIIYVVCANALIRFSAPQLYRKRPIAWIVYSFVCMAALGVAIYCVKGLIIFRCFAWVFGITTLINPAISDVRRGVKIRFNPIAIGMCVLGAISIYAMFLFPHMKASWGGGAPVVVTIHLSKDSPIHPNEKVNAMLLETSDSGFYFTISGDQQTTYIPRALVTGMEYTPPLRIFR
jgi:hypothetical protein